MAIEQKTLNQIQIASPCTASWSAMKGDDQVRHCGDCKLNVYNLSSMSLDEISHLLEKKEGRVCVRFYRRTDGTVITENCPVGVRAVRRKLAMMAAALGSVLAAVGFGMFSSRGAMARTLRESKLGQFSMVRSVAEWMQPEQTCTMMGAPMPMPIRKAPSCGTVPTPNASGGPVDQPMATMGEMVSPELLKKMTPPAQPGQPGQPGQPVR